MGYEINILDQSPICKGETAREALQSTIQLAQIAEELGYKRFWVAEHHNMNQVAGVSPEILIAHLLAQTKTIQIGSGGVMLQHYSPYKVAENFNLLENLAPGRVDVGIGKAPGGLHLATKALQYGKAPTEVDFNERITLFKHFLDNDLPETHKLFGVEATPMPEDKLDLFLLGGSRASAEFATELAAHFVFARFLNNSDDDLEKIADWHLSENKASGRKLIVAVAVLAAETDQAAKELAKQIKLYQLTFSDGKQLSVQSKEHVEALRKQTRDPFSVVEKKVAVIAGTAEAIKTELDSLHLTYGIDEFIFHTPLLNRQARLESFKQLAKVYRKEEVTL